MAEEKGGAGKFPQKIFVAEAPQTEGTGETGTLRSFQINLGVSDINRFGRTAAQLPQRCHDGVGTGFASHGGTLANGRGDVVGKKALIQRLHGGMEFVGDNRHANTARLEFGEQGHDAGIGRSEVQTMRHVIGSKTGKDLLEVTFAKMLAHSVFHEKTNAVAQETAHLGGGAFGESVLTQSVVHGVGQIGQRVQKRAV